MCKEEEESIKVDVHEACGRVKLFWILALSDARNLKSLVEFRQGATTSASFSYIAASENDVGKYSGSVFTGNGSCRYCGSVISPSSLSPFDDRSMNVCSESDCQVNILIAISNVKN